MLQKWVVIGNKCYLALKIFTLWQVHKNRIIFSTHFLVGVGVGVGVLVGVGVGDAFIVFEGVGDEFIDVVGTGVTVTIVGQSGTLGHSSGKI